MAIQATDVSSSNMVTTILSDVNALLADLYELNMVASYLRRGMVGAATFSLFVRRLPATRGFIVAAGVESCLDFLERLRFEEEDLSLPPRSRGLRTRRYRCVQTVSFHRRCLGHTGRSDRAGWRAAA